MASDSARSRGLDQNSAAHWLLTAARARFTVEHWAKDARAKGPPNDEEVAAMSTIFWREVDRPAGVVVVHAVAIVQKGTDKARARQVVEAIRVAVVGASSYADFIARGKAVAHEGVDVVVESLPAVAADGRLIDQSGQLDPAFSLAANQITNPGDTSAVVESGFGLHIIRLVERIPPRQMPIEGRRLAFAPDAFDGRARSVKEHRLEELRASVPVSVESSADTLMRAVVIAQP